MIPLAVNVVQYPPPTGNRCYNLGKAIRRRSSQLRPGSEGAWSGAPAACRTSCRARAPASSTASSTALPRSPDRRSRSARADSAHRLRARGRFRRHRARDVADHARRARRGGATRSTASTTCRRRTPPSGHIILENRAYAHEDRARRRRRLRHKHLEAAREDRRRRSRLAGRRGELEATREVGAEVSASPRRPPISPRACALPGRRCGDPVHADADARRAGDPVPARRASTCRSRSRWPTRLADAERSRSAAGDAACVCDGRPHAPLQSQPPVGAPADRRRRARASSRWTCRPTSSAAGT